MAEIIVILLSPTCLFYHRVLVKPLMRDVNARWIVRVATTVLALSQSRWNVEGVPETRSPIER